MTGTSTFGLTTGSRSLRSFPEAFSLGPTMNPWSAPFSKKATSEASWRSWAYSTRPAKPSSVRSPDRPFEDVDVEPSGPPVVGQKRIRGPGEPGRGLGAAVNGAGVRPHPRAYPAEPVEGPVVEIPPAGRADVEQQVAALADRLDEHADELADGFPGRFVPVIAPGAGEGLAGLPGRRAGRRRGGPPGA